MKILLAPDKFKSSMTAAEVARAIESGLRSAWSEKGKLSSVEFVHLPVADGGDGLLSALLPTLDGVSLEVPTTDALGKPIVASIGWIESRKLAIIEMAEASGLRLIETCERDPWRASSRGTGELMNFAIKRGAEEILLGIGGSATNDGGLGLATALGWSLIGPDGAPHCFENANDLAEIKSLLPPESWVPPRVTVACDVVNPLLGPDGATRVYGPQKGISEDDFERHESRFEKLLSLLGPKALEWSTTPGAGAAGGLGFG
ncbi:MAG: glycerate kinase, partial [Verrucomicrobiota bacterium]